MLLECDRQGQVIWLSGQARSAPGVHGNLAQVLEALTTKSGIKLHLFQILSLPESLLLSAETEDGGAAVERQHAAGLRRLERRLLDHYFRLQTIERSLSVRAARTKRGGGRVAMRQIELERQRIGHELHTGVGQMLAAIRLQLEFVAGQLGEPAGAVRQALDNLAALASGASGQVRSISRRLHPPEWQRLTIEAALQQLWEMSGIPLRYEVRLHLQTLDREPEPEVKALLYRTAQEGLSNIMEHSKANSVAMSLAQSGDLVRLVLEDDGVGFDSDALARAPFSVSSGIGLRASYAQAAALGAKMEVTSGPNGTTLVLTTHFSAEY
jgi:signal transduction histidine kinase